MSDASGPTEPPSDSHILPLWRAGLLSRCPACHKGALFTGLLTVVPQCRLCGTSLSAHDAGDGPAFFAITLMSLLVVALAAWLELAYAPPVWLHMALWTPFILIGSLLSLRVFKGLLIAYEYRHTNEHFTAEPPDDPHNT